MPSKKSVDFTLEIVVPEAVKQAQKALNLLKDAILEVLYQARLEGEDSIRGADIRKQLGIPKLQNGPNLQDFPIRHILGLLQEDGKVEQREPKGPWRITDSAYQERQEKHR